MINRVVERKKILFMIIAILCSGILSVFLGTRFENTIGNIKNAEYRNFWGAMNARQEIDICYSHNLSVYVVPEYEMASDAQGINIALVAGDNILAHRFVKLNSLEKGRIEEIKLELPELKKIKGKVEIVLQSIGLDEQNYVKLIISPEKTKLYIEEEIHERTCFVMKYSYVPFWNMMVTFIINIFVSYFLIGYSIPYVINIFKNKKWKLLLLILMFSTIFAFGITSLRQWMVIQRGEVETIDLKQGMMVQQELLFNSTDEIVINCYLSKEVVESESTILVKLVQGDYYENAEINLGEYQGGFWNYLHIDSKRFDNGPVTINIIGTNLGEEHITLLLAEGMQHIDLKNAVVDGKVQLGKTLLLRYKYFNFSATIVLWLVVLVVVIFLLSVWEFFGHYAKDNLLIMLAVILMLITSIQSGVFTVELTNGWSLTPWFLSYKYGFISRALPGTILLGIQKILTGTAYITTEDLRILFIILTSLLCWLVLCWISKMLKECKSNFQLDYYKAVENVTYLYVLSPIFMTFYCYPDRLGRLDIILDICFVGCCYLIVMEKWLYLIPLFTAIAILSHQIFIFTLLPVLLAVMMYEWLVEKRRKFLIPAILTFVIDAILGFYCQFYGNIKGMGLSEVMSDMQGKTNAPLLELMVSSEQFMSTQMFTDYYRFDFVDFAIVFRYIGMVMLLLPLYYVYIRIWKESITELPMSLKKVGLTVISLCPLCVVPLWFTVAYDWGRWTVEYGMAAFFGIFMMIRKKNVLVLDGVRKVDQEFKKKIGKIWPFYFGIVFILLGRLDDAQAFGITTQFKQFAENFMKIIGY